MASRTNDDSVEAVPQRIARLEQLLEKERAARRHAEQLLAEKSKALSLTNQSLLRLAEDLETRVKERTGELALERERAVLLAREDQLTGLANRRFYNEFLADACAKAVAEGSQLALFLIDIDHFKHLNDGLGHEAADDILKLVAQRLCDIWPDALISRLGGDEFAVIAKVTGDHLALEADASRVSTAFAVPFGDQGRDIELSCSVGFAVLPQDAQTAGDLQRYSDMALTASKRSGRRSTTAFNAVLRDEVEEKMRLGTELAEAISGGQIIPWFQPIVDASTGRIKGLEALARWEHPERGLLSPHQFIPLAEERKLMDALFQSITRQSCQAALPHVVSGQLDYLSVNVSPSQFRWNEMSTTIRDLLKEIGFPPRALALEITEELVFADVAASLRELSRISQQGIRIALDDFGTGYSNIAALRRLPIDWLKLDRSLIVDIDHERVDQEIIYAVLIMARGLDLEVIAEGIETPAQADWLLSAGCRRHQGFFYGKPSPIQDLVPHFA